MIGLFAGVLSRRSAHSPHSSRIAVSSGHHKAANVAASGGGDPSAHASVPRFNHEPAAVPEPTAFRTLRESRTLSAAQLFNSERRNPRWAPEMERVMKERFTSDRLKGLGLSEMSVSDLECRESTCRFDIEYPESLADKPPASDIPLQAYTPVDLLAYLSGRFAPVTQVLKPETASDGRLRETVVIVLDGESIDPAKYSQWVHAHQIQRPGSTGTK